MEGDEICPIGSVQFIYNYDACNNEVATKILNELVENDGTCIMFKRFRKDFEIGYGRTLFDDLQEKWNNSPK